MGTAHGFSAQARLLVITAPTTSGWLYLGGGFSLSPSQCHPNVSTYALISSVLHPLELVARDGGELNEVFTTPTALHPEAVRLALGA